MLDRVTCIGHSERVGEDVPQMNAWGDLRVGDEVRVIGYLARRDTFVVVELRRAHDLLTPEHEDVMAVIRGASGEVHTVEARNLERA